MPDRLSQFIEDDGALTLQSHAVRRGDDAAPVAVEQPDADRALQFHNRFGNAGLSDAAIVYGALAVEPCYEVEQVPSAVALVEAGLGVTALPSLTFAIFKGRSLAARQLIEPVMRRHIGFATRAQRTLPAFAADLMDAIRKRLQHELGTKSARR